MGKILNYKILGTAFKSLSDACFKADEQQRNGEKITACGMSDDDLDRLCDIIPDMLNPMLSTEEVKEKLHVSDATLNRMVARGRFAQWRVQEARSHPILEEVGYTTLH